MIWSILLNHWVAYTPKNQSKSGWLHLWTQTWTGQVLLMCSLLPRETLKQISFCKNYTLIIVYMNNIVHNIRLQPWRYRSALMFIYINKLETYSYFATRVRNKAWGDNSILTTLWFLKHLDFCGSPGIWCRFPSGPLTPQFSFWQRHFHEFLQCSDRIFLNGISCKSCGLCNVYTWCIIKWGILYMHTVYRYCCYCLMTISSI